MMGGFFKMAGGGGAAMFRCEAVYHGRQAVLGAQSSATLTLLIEHLLTPHTPTTHAHANSHTYTKLRSERCQLQCDDERLQVTPIRKDEGFESDSESSGSTCDESFCGNQDIKVISDHVLRLDHLIHHDSSSNPPFTSSSSSDDSSSSATSSGNESEDDTPRTNPDCLGTPHPNGHSQVEGVCGSVSGSSGGGGVGVGGGGGGNGSSSSSSIGDTFLMSDILYCHVAPATPRVVVVVVKDAGSSQVLAHVFQCVTAEAAKALYAHYKEASNKYKLNRYRNSKRKSDVNASDGINNNNSATVCKSSGSSHKDVSSSKPPSGSTSSISKATGGGRGSIRSVEARLLKSEKRRDLGSNVNVIEIRETPQQQGTEEARPWNLVQHTDANGVTHIEIESGPCSLLSSSSDPSDFNGLINPLSGQHSGQMTMNSLTALSTHKLENADNGSNIIQGSNSCPTSLVTTEREILVAGEIDKKTRQRHPAQYLRGSKFSLQDHFRKSEDKRSEEKTKRSEFMKSDDHRREEKRNREEGRREEREGRREEREGRREEREGRSRRGRHEVELRNNSNNNNNINNNINNSGREMSVVQATMEGILPRLSQERQSRPRDQSRTRLRHSHNKGPAPPPPPRRHPNNPSLLLVPTKSGAEHARAFYPKESHIIRGNKIVRVEYPAYNNTWMHHDINNNPHHYNYYTHGSAWIGAHEYHAVRPREATISNEMRRRSRSKSPARRPMAHRYIDAVSTFNLSQKLKDISEAVFTGKRNTGSSGQGHGIGNGSNSSTIQTNGVSQVNNREGKGHHHHHHHQRSMSSVSASAVEGGDGTLKSVIKKGRKVEASPQTRRVTFSAYATVQVMEA